MSKITAKADAVNALVWANQLLRLIPINTISSLSKQKEKKEKKNEDIQYSI